MDYVEYLTAKAISIHAPRTGSDRPRRRDAKKDSHFNPRSPHGERHTTIDVQGGAWVFQSTLPARGATGSRGMILMPGTFQSTLPARGATVAYSTCLLLTPYFNPRSPHGERRTPAFSDSSVTLFQSTLPARGATAHALGILRAAEISIHAPRTGSDRSRAGHSPRRRDFNPRSPHGERRSADWRGRVPPEHFNPRSPHGERRRIATSFCATADNFNPRSPHGERREAVQLCRDENISIHAPRTGSDSPFG